jgi:hypothetical protein
MLAQKGPSLDKKPRRARVDRYRDHDTEGVPAVNGTVK